MGRIGQGQGYDPIMQSDSHPHPDAVGQRSRNVPDGTVRVSVVVPTRNRSERLVRLLDALVAQDMSEPFEVVVVDDASSDDTLTRLRAFVTMTSVPLTVVPSAVNAGPGSARNNGWRSARGDVIAFTDDDCVPDPGWLRALTDGLSGADIAVGRTRPPEEQLPLIGPFSNYLDLDHNGSYSTCNIAYRRDVLIKMDGFDQDRFRWPNGEDTDLGLRSVKAGYRDTYVPGALVWHDVSPSNLRSHWTRIPRLDGLVALVAAHPEARATMGAGWFLRSVDKAVLIAWVAVLGLLVRPHRIEFRVFAVLAAVIYVWQFRKCHYAARTPGEAVLSVPQGFLADSRAVMVLLRSSARHGTLLL
jgi:GT2 family glycosyltransferase